MLVSIVLVSYNTAEMTIDALKSLFHSVVDFDLEVVIVDNASSDHSVALIKEKYPDIPLIENKKNVGFGRANNQALDLIGGDYVLLLNTDAFVEKDTLQKTVDYMKGNPSYGVLGLRLVGRDGEQQPSCRYFPTVLNLFSMRVGLNRIFPNIKLVDDVKTDHTRTQSCDWVPGCYYLVSREVINTVGLFDPTYFMYSEEVDHCFAVRKAGWDVVYFAEASVIHIGGESAKSVGAISTVSRQVPVLQIESELIYFRKNHGIVTAIAHIILSNIADLYQLFKDVLTLKSMGKIKYNLHRIFSYYRLFFKTGFGKKSTR